MKVDKQKLMLRSSETERDENRNAQAASFVFQRGLRWCNLGGRFGTFRRADATQKVTRAQFRRQDDLFRDQRTPGEGRRVPVQIKLGRCNYMLVRINQFLFSLYNFSSCKKKTFFSVCNMCDMVTICQCC